MLQKEPAGQGRQSSSALFEVRLLYVEIGQAIADVAKGQ